MALNDVLTAGGKKTPDGPPESKFVGMKLDYADYKELLSLLGLTEAAGGAGAFKAMLGIVLEAKS
jgi:hypothetical protein